MWLTALIDCVIQFAPQVKRPCKLPHFVWLGTITFSVLNIRICFGMHFFKGGGVILSMTRGETALFGSRGKLKKR